MWRPSLSLSSILGCMCRLTGLAFAVLVLSVSLSRGLVASTPLAVLQVGSAMLLAVLIGNVAKEFAFGLAEWLVTACGRPFVRHRTTFTGRLVSEVWLPGGIWVCWETWRSGAALTWTEGDGSCTGIELPAMTLASSRPPLPGKPSYLRHQLQGLIEAATLVTGRPRADTLAEDEPGPFPGAPGSVPRFLRPGSTFDSSLIASPVESEKPGPDSRP